MSTNTPTRCQCRGDHYAAATQGFVRGQASRRPAYRYTCGPNAGQVMHSPDVAVSFRPAPKNVAETFARREAWRRSHR